MRVASRIHSSSHHRRLSKLQVERQSFGSTIATAISTVDRTISTGAASIDDIEHNHTAAGESVDEPQFDGHLVEELTGRASVARQAGNGSAVVDPRGNRSHSLGDNEGGAGESSGRHSNQRRCREEKIVFPLLAHQVWVAQLARRSMQALSANGVREMLHEDANTNRAFQQCSGSAFVALASEQPDRVKCTVAESSWWSWRVVSENADGATTTNWCWSKGKISF